MKNSISVVMPVYNRENMLKEAVQSILSQTQKDWELVLVDDASTDKSFDICQEFARNDSRIKATRLDQNSGEPVARHEGNIAATGEIIVVADSDDICYPERLAIINKAFSENPDLDVFYTNIDLYYTDSGEIKRRFFQPFNKELLKHINFIPNPGSSYKREKYFELPGYDAAQRISCDYDLWLQFIDKNANFGYDPAPTVKMTMHPGSIRIEKQAEHKNYLNRVRQKHNLPLSNLEEVKKLANEETYLFFSQPQKIDLWFN